MVTSPQDYKIKSVTLIAMAKKNYFLNGNKVPQAKKKLIVLQNWNLEPFGHGKTLRNKVLLWKMPASGKEIFIWCVEIFFDVSLDYLTKKHTTNYHTGIYWLVHLNYLDPFKGLIPDMTPELKLTHHAMQPLRIFIHSYHIQWFTISFAPHKKYYIFLKFLGLVTI